MVQLPVWELALVIFIPQSLAFLARPWLLRRFVDTVTPIRQSFYQFRLELGLYLAAGLSMAFILYFAFGFPIIESGMKLVLGVFTVGLFAALDLSLARERDIIEKASSRSGPFEPPRRLSPLTTRFTLVASIILLLITAIILLVVIRDVNWLAEQGLTMDSLTMLSRSVLVEILFVMGFLLVMVINLVFSYARNMRILFDNETEVLELVTRGDLSRRVPVTTSDEMGVIAGHTNTMISALREGVRMREGLLIAQEVQQHFLPETPPGMPGVDMAGSAVFSDETGGDFYDFVACEMDACSTLTVVVGDVSGHGIGAALLMAAGRSLVRQALNQSTSLAENIASANNHLARDIEGSGRFITLFAFTMDPVTGEAAWVNAGHQPPLIYDIPSDSVTELRGDDIPLGVEKTWQYHAHTIPLPDAEEILLIGTDGVWEARNDAGEMFGPKRVKQVLRANAQLNAAGLVGALVDAVHDFSGGRSQEDDVTLVVIKGKKN